MSVGVVDGVSEMFAGTHAKDFVLWEGEIRSIEVAQLPKDEVLRDATCKLVGNLAARNTIEVSPVEEKPPMNLAEAIKLAREGSAEALAMVRANVTSDYFERAYKSGFVMEVIVTKDKDGKLIQHGQSYEDIHVNTLLHMANKKLRKRGEIEALNAARDQYLVDNDLLRDNARVIFSLVHEEMSDSEAEEQGFFVPTKSIAIQLLTDNLDGTYLLQSAFVAGRESVTDEVFDKQAIVQLGEMIGANYQGATTEEILGRPQLVEKGSIPDFVLDIAALFDKAAYAVTGKNKFFGRDIDLPQSRLDYVRKLEECRQKVKNIKNEVESTVRELLVAQPATPTEATVLLDKINDRLLKERIVRDITIDARVLGTEATYFVEHARHLVSIGHYNHIDMMMLQRFIMQKGKSSSCPGGAGSSGESDDGIFGVNSEQEATNNLSSSSKMLEDCEFVSKECPKCGAKNVKTECKKGVYYGACGCTSK